MLTTSSTETGSEPYPLLQTVWDHGISDPAVWCSAMWFGGVLEVSLVLWRESWQDPLGICVIVHTRNVPKKGQATWLDYCKTGSNHGWSKVQDWKMSDVFPTGPVNFFLTLLFGTSFLRNAFSITTINRN